MVSDDGRCLTFEPGIYDNLEGICYGYYPLWMSPEKATVYIVALVLTLGDAKSKHGMKDHGVGVDHYSVRLIVATG